MTQAIDIARCALLSPKSRPHPFKSQETLILRDFSALADTARPRTTRELPVSIRGKSVEFVRESFMGARP